MAETIFRKRGGSVQKDDHSSKRKEQQRIQQLEEKLRKRHEVLSELMEEHIKLKKELGGFKGRLGYPAFLYTCRQKCCTVYFWFVRK